MNFTRFIHKDELNRQWYIIDAKDQILGRLCSNIAKILRGKHRPTFTPNIDSGDYVVVVNADKIRLTGKKSQTKTYEHFSGYPGGLKIRKFREVLQKSPATIITHAVRGMLPHNKLGRKMIKKLKVYAGPEHPHAAQNPQLITITKPG